MRSCLKRQLFLLEIVSFRFKPEKKGRVCLEPGKEGFKERPDLTHLHSRKW